MTLSVLSVPPTHVLYVVRACLQKRLWQTSKRPHSTPTLLSPTGLQILPGSQLLGIECVKTATIKGWQLSGFRFSGNVAVFGLTAYLLYLCTRTNWWHSAAFLQSDHPGADDELVMCTRDSPILAVQQLETQVLRGSELFDEIMALAGLRHPGQLVNMVHSLEMPLAFHQN